MTQQPQEASGTTGHRNQEPVDSSPAPMLTAGTEGSPTAGGRNDLIKKVLGASAIAAGGGLSVRDFVALWERPVSHLPLAALAGIGLAAVGMKVFPAITQAERRHKMWWAGPAFAVSAMLGTGALNLWGLPYGLQWMGLHRVPLAALRYTTVALPMTWVGGIVAGKVAASAEKCIRRGTSPVVLKPGEVYPSNLVLGHSATDPDEGVVLLESDRYMHVLVVGPTGSGKTATALSPMIVQDLANPDVGATVVEPKGDWILGIPGERDGIKQWGEKLGRTVYVIDPDNPDTDVYNPMYGDMHMVAESISTALKSLFQTKASYFADTQEALLKHVIYLLKWLRGDNLTFRDLHRVIGDYAMLLNLSTELATRYAYWEGVGFPETITDDDREELLKLIEWFRRETTGEMGGKLQEHTRGIRVQLDNMMANKYFRRCILPDSEPKRDKDGRVIGRRVIDLDRHLANNSILCVSTNDGLLAGMSQVLGKLLLTALQYAASRRFKQPKERRRPHTIYVDEAPTYLTESWADFQAKARGFNISIVLALQTIFQFEKVARGFTQTIVGNSRTRILYGGLPREDVEYWMGSFGTREEEEVSRSTNERTATVEGGGDLLLYPFGSPKQYGSGETRRTVDKDLLTFNDLYWMDRGLALVQMVRNGNVQKPIQVKVDLVRRLPERIPGHVVPPEAGLAVYGGPPLPSVSGPPKDDLDDLNKKDDPGRTETETKQGGNKGSYTPSDARRDAEKERKGNPNAHSVVGKLGVLETPPDGRRKTETTAQDSPAGGGGQGPVRSDQTVPATPVQASSGGEGGSQSLAPDTPRLNNVRPIRPDVHIPIAGSETEEANDDRPFEAESPSEGAPKGRPLPKPGTPLGRTGLESPPIPERPKLSTGDDYPKNPYDD